MESTIIFENIIDVQQVVSQFSLTSRQGVITCDYLKNVQRIGVNFDLKNNILYNLG